jgi:hypothetical protein
LNTDNAGHHAILEELSCLSEAFQSEDVTFKKSKRTLELKANTGKDKHCHSIKKKPKHQLSTKYYRQNKYQISKQQQTRCHCSMCLILQIA